MSGQKRVGYLISQYPAVNHTFIMREIRGLRELGWDVLVASIRAPDREDDKLAADELEERRATYFVLPHGPANLIGAQLRTILRRPAAYVQGLLYALRLSRWDLKKCAAHLGYFAEAVAVGAWMAREKLDHLHTHFASSVALFVPRILPIRLSMSIHGSGEFTDSIGFLIPEKVASSAMVRAISTYGRSQLMRVSRLEDWPKIRVVRLGVDQGTFEFKLPRANPDIFQVICVGTITLAKGQSILIDACRLLRQEGRAVRLNIVGHGPDERSIERYAADTGMTDAVVFHGAMAHDRVLELYRQMDLFALASFAEGIPVVLMEAMALGLPCVATNITGIPELIQDGRDGLLVPPSDVCGCARAIAQLMDSHELRIRIAESARRRIVEEYDQRRNVARMAELLETV